MKIFLGILTIISLIITIYLFITTNKFFNFNFSKSNISTDYSFSIVFTIINIILLMMYLNKK